MKKLYVGVIGGSEVDSTIKQKAYEVGKLLAKHDAIVICGGLGGVMEAVSKGANENGGIVIGILPDADKSSGNKYLTYSISTGIGTARNSIIINTADAIIAIGGKYGTLSELGYALNKGLPIASIDSWKILKLPQIKQCNTGNEAVTYIFSALNKNGN